MHIWTFAYNVFLAYLVPLFQNESPCKNEFDLYENEPVGGTHFHMNGFARRLVLTQRQKTTREWPIPFKLSSDQTVLLPTNRSVKAAQSDKNIGDDQNPPAEKSRRGYNREGLVMT